MAQNYLVLNQSGYYFRIIVPVDLRSMIGMREINRSLKTGVLGLAKEKARMLAGKIQRLYRALREDKMSKELDQKKIQELVRIHVQETLEWIEDEPFTREKPISIEEISCLRKYSSGFKSELVDLIVDNLQNIIGVQFTEFCPNKGMEVFHITRMGTMDRCN